MNYITNNEMKKLLYLLEFQRSLKKMYTGLVGFLCFSKCFKRQGVSYVESVDLWKVMNLRDRLEAK